MNVTIVIILISLSLVHSTSYYTIPRENLNVDPVPSCIGLKSYYTCPYHDSIIKIYYSFKLAEYNKKNLYMCYAQILCSDSILGWINTNVNVFPHNYP